MRNIGENIIERWFSSDDSHDINDHRNYNENYEYIYDGIT